MTEVNFKEKENNGSSLEEIIRFCEKRLNTEFSNLNLFEKNFIRSLRRFYNQDRVITKKQEKLLFQIWKKI